MTDIFTLDLKSGKSLIFRVKPFHFQNPGLRETFNTTYPTIAVFYKREGITFKRINTHVIDDPSIYFNTNPIDNELKEITTVLLLEIGLPSPREKALELLDKLQHEIIDEIPFYLQIGHVGQ